MDIGEQERVIVVEPMELPLTEPALPDEPSHEPVPVAPEADPDSIEPEPEPASR